MTDWDIIQTIGAWILLIAWVIAEVEIRKLKRRIAELERRRD